MAKIWLPSIFTLELYPGTNLIFSSILNLLYRTFCKALGISWGRNACQFHVADETNYHNLGCLKQKKLIPSQFWRPKIQNQFHQDEIQLLAGPYFHWKLQRIIHSLLLLASDGYFTPWLMSTSLQYLPPGLICLLFFVKLFSVSLLKGHVI